MEGNQMGVRTTLLPVTLTLDITVTELQMTTYWIAKVPSTIYRYWVSYSGLYIMYIYKVIERPMSACLSFTKWTVWSSRSGLHLSFEIKTYQQYNHLFYFFQCTVNEWLFWCATSSWSAMQCFLIFIPCRTSAAELAKIWRINLSCIKPII